MSPDEKNKQVQQDEKKPKEEWPKPVETDHDNIRSIPPDKLEKADKKEG